MYLILIPFICSVFNYYFIVNTYMLSINSISSISLW